MSTSDEPRHPEPRHPTHLPSHTLARRPAPRATPATRLPPPGAGPPIRVTDTAELVASVPALLGYHPRDSLVLIGTGGPSGRRVGLTLRVDIPDSRHVEAVVADTVRCLLGERPTGAAVIVLGAGRDGPAPPHAELAALITAALDHNGVPAHTVVWAESTAAGARWACYGPCRCGGRLPDPSSTVLAAAVVARGQVIHADRGELECVVAAADPDRIRRRERLLLARLDAADAAGPTTGAADGAGIAAVDAAIAAAAGGRLVIDDATAVELACALGDTRVRDTAMVRALGRSAAAAEQLWAALARELPDPEAAEPAALLAVSALLRGDGALANVALDRAERAWPGHRLTGLLRLAADSGVRPGVLRAWLNGDGGVLR